MPGRRPAAIAPATGRPRAARPRAGFTLIEAALVICIVGVVLAVFVPTFVRHLRTSKIAEAPEQLARLHARTASYWDARHEGPDGRTHTRCLPAEAGPAPAETSTEAQEVDLSSEDTPGHATWSAIGFAPERPLRYRYSLLPQQSGCELKAPQGEDEPLVTFRAEGDLDGDEQLSTFERSAGVAKDGSLEPVGVLYVVDRVE